MIDNARIVRIALSTTENLDRLNRLAAQYVICARALRIRELLDRRSIAMRTLDATPIACTIESVEPEETTRRLIITFRPERVREGFPQKETIRSDRTDGTDGDTVSSMWKAVSGKRAILYKTLEETGNEDKPRIRVAPYVELV
jgi:hypothetical protein